jgi:hypothetical protein
MRENPPERKSSRGNVRKTLKTIETRFAGIGKYKPQRTQGTQRKTHVERGRRRVFFDRIYRMDRIGRGEKKPHAKCAQDAKDWEIETRFAGIENGLGCHKGHKELPKKRPKMPIFP